MAPAMFAETLYNLNVVRGLFPKDKATYFIKKNPWPVVRKLIM
jgi:hypothetical protein